MSGGERTTNTQLFSARNRGLKRAECPLAGRSTERLNWGALRRTSKGLHEINADTDTEHKPSLYSFPLHLLKENSFLSLAIHDRARCSHSPHWHFDPSLGSVPPECLMSAPPKGGNGFSSG
jgi:hypothetical protein